MQHSSLRDGWLHPSVLLTVQAVNKILEQRHAAGLLEVLSFGEGLPTRVSRALPNIHIVPPEAANPGYGDYITMEQADHVNTCKPLDETYDAYARLRNFLLLVRDRLTDAHDEPG